MEITYKDRSEFLRGYLILIRKDKIINEQERTMSLIIRKHFGFAEDFCIESLANLLENEFISEEPPIFSNKIIADYFVRESYRITGQIRPLEEDVIKWFVKTAQANNINPDMPSFQDDQSNFATGISHW